MLENNLNHKQVDVICPCLKPTLLGGVEVWHDVRNHREESDPLNGSHFICSLNLNNPELTVFIVFKMTNIASENQSFFNSLIGNNNKKVNAKFLIFYKTFGGLGLLISKAQSGA